ncbi:WGxxGxxG family protein [Pedomonas sp. V897]|uniref:WGxxGxxG family protein n=1 Tax=Pedomonas sp. V897 TaxID=3446482 RepID=UPI003EE0E449
MRFKLKGAAAAGAVVLAAGLSGPGAARIDEAVVPRNVENAEPTELPADQDFEYGWVGLLGLAGLLGQRRMRRTAREHA